MRVLSAGTPPNRLKAALEDVVNPALFLLVFLIFTIILFRTRDGAPNDTGNGFSCSGNDPSFPWQSGRNTFWNLNSFLNIDLAGGQLTFSQAKAIDIGWDLVVGRGGQIFAAFIAYRLMRRSLLRSMESKAMHIPVTATLVFDGMSLTTLGHIYRDLAASVRKERRWNMRLFAIFLMIVYLTSFGTIVSAMTGYQTQLTPLVWSNANGSTSDNANDLIASSNIVLGESAVVEDGRRIGLEPFATLLRTAQPKEYTMLSLYSSSLTARSGNTNFTQCVNSVSDSNNDKNFTILVAWMDKRCVIFNSDMTFRDLSYDLGRDALKVEVKKFWTMNDNHTIRMSEKYLQNNSVCQPGKTYKWGFSSQLLLLFCSITTIYAGLVAVLHWDVRRFGRANNLDHRTGLYRDILDLALEIDNELDVNDKDVYLTAAALEATITTRTGSIAVKVDELPPMRRERRRRKPIADIEEEAARDYEAFLRK